MNRIAIPAAEEATGPWYLAYTKPRQEQVALANLQQQGFEAYLPLYKTFKKSPVGASDAVIVFEPMFARYVFFRPRSARQSIAPVRATRGVSSLVSFGFEPATIGHELLRAIRACEQARNQADPAALSPFQPGSRVELRSGPLKGLVGVVQMVSAKRVALLLELLGRPQRVEVAPQALALA